MKEVVVRKVFPAGVEIFHEGDPGDIAYYIERGQVEISTEGSEGREHIATLGPGEMFGEMALLDREVRSATATASTEVVTIAIHRHQVEARYARTDPLLKLFIQVILRRFRETQAKAWRTPTLDELSPGPFRLDQSAMVKEALDDLLLYRDLQLGLGRGEFELYLQPLVALSDCRLVGFEALVRWRSEERGFVSPGAFIPLAEKTGLIVPLGRWVLEEACRQLARLQKEAELAHGEAAEPLFMSINLSPRQLGEEDEVEWITETLQRTGLSLSSIKLEVTENLLLEDPERAGAALGMLKATGARLSLDDFGTGYSSLTYLQRYPFDTLKIDRAFIRGMSRDPNSRKILRAIARLGNALDMEVVAEGVETAEEVRQVADYGCHVGQGYYFSRPLPFEQALELVRRGRFSPCPSAAEP